MRKEPNCYACKYSYMEPDEPYLICGHADEGTFGTYIHNTETSLATCNFTKFEQHPLRKRNGELKK